MSLFPAYADAGGAVAGGETAALPVDVAPVSVAPRQVDSDTEMLSSDDESMTSDRESALLAEPPAPPAPAPPPVHTQRCYYDDRSREFGHLPLSTLYFPARPQYEAADRRKALGAHAVTAGPGTGRRRPRPRRYWSRTVAPPTTNSDAMASAERALSFRQALADTPFDEDLWLRYIHFQEWCAEGGDNAALAEALDAAERGAKQMPHSWRLQAAFHAQLRRALAPEAYVDRLRDMLQATAEPERRLSIWARLLSAVACLGAPDAAAAVRAVAAAAANDLRHYPPAYPDIVYVYGAFLRSGGLWEQLVQLIELVVAMNFPPSSFPPKRDADAELAAEKQLRDYEDKLIELVVAMNFPPSSFPPKRDADAELAAEKQLREYEDKVIGSGLPLSEVWSRVERARDALQWRAPVAPLEPHELAADPQREPLAPDVADLLLPVVEPRAAFRLLIVLLRLADAPLLPAGTWAHLALCPTRGELSASWEATGARSLVALIRAARRLPPAHPVRRALAGAGAGAARRLLRVAPHRAYTSDDSTGFESWASSLWDAALLWTSGRRRLAILCWRLRVLHATLLTVDATEADAGGRVRRIRSSARDLLRRWAGDDAVAFAHFARLDAAAAATVDAGSGAVKGARGLQAALQAARAACAACAVCARAGRGDSPAPAPPTAPRTHALFAARVVSELADEGKDAAVSLWATCCAVLRQPLPPMLQVQRAPPTQMVQMSLDECERQCCEVERALVQGSKDEEEEAGAEWALLPDEAEWGAARARLASASRRGELLRKLTCGEQPTMAQGDALTARWLRFCEQSACALVSAGGGEVRGGEVRLLAARFPLNAYLALEAAGAPLWRARSDALSSAAGAPASASALETQALATMLPPLLAALQADWAPHEAELVSRVGARVCARGGALGPAGGALLRALRLEGAARHRPGASAQAQRALVDALHRAPHYKWVHVRGASLLLGAGESQALPDALLEKGLRLRALPDELRPLPDQRRTLSDQLPTADDPSDQNQ